MIRIELSSGGRPAASSWPIPFPTNRPAGTRAGGQPRQCWLVNAQYLREEQVLFGCFLSSPEKLRASFRPAPESIPPSRFQGYKRYTIPDRPFRAPEQSRAQYLSRKQSREFVGRRHGS